MLKKVGLINKIFGCFITYEILNEELLEFRFIDRDFLSIRYENMESELFIYQGEVLKDNEFVCTVSDLNVFNDFKSKNKTQFYEEN